jgi:hypothetical protein
LSELYHLEVTLEWFLLSPMNCKCNPEVIVVEPVSVETEAAIRATNMASLRRTGNPFGIAAIQLESFVTRKLRHHNGRSISLLTSSVYFLNITDRSQNRNITPLFTGNMLPRMGV